jgi:hypothetical protein
MALGAPLFGQLFSATASADALSEAAIAIEIAAAKPAPIAIRLLIKSSIEG